ncbi:MAG TPA: type II toxin-antitoxin system VapC family toxin [Planctomycetota bacterium]|nr:type II toxin-antitoxin system VapC family toxin [Planctomycetota bacterium]
MSQHVHFLDSSALVKLYIREPGTDAMLDLAGKAETRFTVLSLARVECRAALRRRQRSRDLSEATASKVLAQVDTDLRDFFSVQPVDDSVISRAAQLIDKHPLRAYDALQLSGFLQLQDQTRGATTVFVCSDQQLVAVARAEGALCFEPVQEEKS